MKYEYANGVRDRYKTTEKAQEKMREIYKRRFEEGKNKINVSKRGYKLIRVPGRGEMKYHRYLWEKEHGTIPKEYVIHHVNGDKLDNRMDNLIMLSERDHLKMHYKEREIDEKGRLK